MEAGLPTGSPANSTPQPLGAKANHYKVAKALLDAGCRVDPRDIVGNSPLMLACGTQSSHASVEIGRLLGQRGASLRHVNRFGYPLLYPAATAPDGIGNELCEHVVRTLIELGADPSQRLEMPRPTGSAAAAGRVGCADLDAEKRRRWTSRRQIKRNQRVAARLQELLGDEWVFADEAEILSDVSEDEDERAAASADEDDSGDVFTWTTRGLYF